MKLLKGKKCVKGLNDGGKVVIKPLKKKKVKKSKEVSNVKLKKKQNPM